ncbi:hypothetical protein HD806DRAFT_502347 [Xylariaceae sp. AK1471]|nr:hypothetical protein HD806DRAFT_502347 [Xylariaceae sp. AK1471]
MSSSIGFEQFAKFANDSTGLERIFRLLQSVVQITLSYPSTLHLLLDPLRFIVQSPLPLATTRSTLLLLQQRLDLARRYLRVFRFLDVFQQAQRLFQHNIVSPQSPPPKGGKPKSSLSLQQRTRAEEWLDLVGRTFCGMYLLLETSTIIDYMQVEGLEVWGPEGKLAVNAEAQRFWLFTLVCGVLSGLLRLRREVLVMEKEKPARGNTTTGNNVAAATEKGSTKGASKDRQLERSKKLITLVRSVVTNALDMVLPGVIVGWLHVSPGVVGLVMFVTTLSTSVDIWERCGREISSQK